MRAKTTNHQVFCFLGLHLSGCCRFNKNKVHLLCQNKGKMLTSVNVKQIPSMETLSKLSRIPRARGTGQVSVPNIMGTRISALCANGGMIGAPQPPYMPLRVRNPDVVAMHSPMKLIRIGGLPPLVALIAVLSPRNPSTVHHTPLVVISQFLRFRSVRVTPSLPQTGDASSALPRCAFHCLRVLISDLCIL